MQPPRSRETMRIIKKETNIIKQANDSSPVNVWNVWKRTKKLLENKIESLRVIMDKEKRRTWNF